MDERRIYASYVNNTDVNGYISELIHEDKQVHGDKEKNKKNGQSKKVMFCSDCINDDLTSLDITV
ncbi:hypothetical protein HNQ80_003819 [Anaerosolibacter carboniphilus]|uniref:Uncharacterized protein n=1 Tax=Anaerosolibacter carboniphilus TaxID=1417629 RepID=A0A841KVK0_9FIRM|nr:hypothetical protein [Anaerosolibacter carboniphilus]MBB6217696.1 hypothetical protein [Anaerosolibacter carboniphilus]